MAKSLRNHLQKALQKAVKLEFATIPPYLTALWSIKPGTNQEAYAVIKSVLMEEMLHMVQAANVLTAIGGSLQFSENNCPVYPFSLEFSTGTGQERPVTIDLAPLSKSTLECFLKIEEPGYLSKPAALRFNKMAVSENTVGEFYKGIRNMLEELVSKEGDKNVFTGDGAMQVSSQFYWGAGGHAVVVTSLETALQAIDIIVDQGEGLILNEKETGKLFGDRDKLPHYFRFLELYNGRRFQEGDRIEEPTGAEIDIDYNSVYNLKPNCTEKDLRGNPELLHLNQLFNFNYTTMLGQIGEGFNGNPQAFYPAIINCMRNLSGIASNMVCIQLDPLKPDPEYAAPCFKFQKPKTKAH